MSFSFRQLRYFIAAAESGQISHAATALNVSQSAVTTAIKQLEDIVGTQLFTREPHGVSLTRDGDRFLVHARQIIAAVSDAIRMPTTQNPQEGGVVRLACTYTVIGYFLPGLLLRFQKAYPNIRLEIIEANRTDVEEMLCVDKVDVGILLTSNVGRPDAIRAETLFRSKRRLWLPAGHELLDKSEVTLGDVADRPYIALTIDEAWDSATRYWEGHPRRPVPILMTSSVEAVRTMVGSGMGLTVLSDMVYRPWSLEGQRIETRDVDRGIPSMDIGLAWKIDAEIPPAVRTFSQFLQRTVGRIPVA